MPDLDNEKSCLNHSTAQYHKTEYYKIYLELEER